MDLFQECALSFEKSISIIGHINRIKEENYITISVSTGIAFAKIQQPFFLKPLGRFILGNMFNPIVCVCVIYINTLKKCSLYIYEIFILSGRMVNESFPFEIKKKFYSYHFYSTFYLWILPIQSCTKKYNM